MKFSRLLSIINTITESAEEEGNQVTNKEFAKKLGIHGEKVTSKELWKVAQDMRKHPADYADIGLINMCVAKYIYDKHNSPPPRMLYDRSRKIVIAENIANIQSLSDDTDEWRLLKSKGGYVQMKLDEKLVELVKNQIRQLVVDKPLKKIRHENNTLKRDYGLTDTEAISRSKNEIGRIKRYNTAINKLDVEVLHLLFSNRIHPTHSTKSEMKFDSDSIQDRIRKHRMALEKKGWAFSGNDEVIYPIIKHLPYLIVAHGTSADNDDIFANALLSYIHCDVPTIYKMLVKKLYETPIHPEEIDKRLRPLGYAFINALHNQGVTPKEMAIQSCRLRGGNYSYGNTWYGAIAGKHGILDVKPDDITKKEAYDWLLGLAKIRIRKRKENENMYDDGIDGDYGHIPMEEELVANFPTFFVEQKANELGIEGQFWKIEISFPTVPVFRWFLKNMGSTYFWKEQNAHGPAGQHRTFKPISQINQIIEEDLVNGVKTSPLVAFQNASQRMAKKHAIADSVKFELDRFPDTKEVKVLRTQGDLRREGEALNHCVGGYGQSCLSGRSFIVALRSSTAELDPNTLHIFQHRAKFNEAPPEKDMEDLQKWIEFVQNRNTKKDFGDYALEA